MAEELAVRGAELNITWPQGSTFDPVFTFYEDAADGPTLDLTGFVARMQVRPKVADKDVDAEGVINEPLWDLDTAAKGGLVLDAAAGTVTGDVSAEITDGMVANKVYRYDLEFVEPSGRVTHELWGTLTFTPAVTR